MSGRFRKGQSGNPAGRPKARRPHVSAFDIIFDKRLTVTQNGVERELTLVKRFSFRHTSRRSRAAGWRSALC